MLTERERSNLAASDADRAVADESEIQLLIGLLRVNIRSNAAILRELSSRLPGGPAAIGSERCPHCGGVSSKLDITN